MEKRVGKGGEGRLVVAEKGRRRWGGWIRRGETKVGERMGKNVVGKLGEEREREKGGWRRMSNKGTVMGEKVGGSVGEECGHK